VNTAPIHVVDAGKVYRRLLGYARPHLRMFMIGVVGMVLFAATDALLVVLVQKFLAGAFVAPDPRILWAIPLGAVLLFVLRGIGDYVSNFFPGWVGRQIIKSMRAELFGHYLRLPVRYYESAATGDLLSRLTLNIERVAEATTNAVTVMIRDTLTILGLIGMLFYYNWQLATFVLLLAPPISWLIQFINRAFRRYSARIQASMGDVTRVAKEALDAQRVIKAFNAERHEEAIFEVANERNRHSNMRLIAARSLANPVVQMIAAVGLAGVLYFSIRQVSTREMQVDEFMAFLTALLMITAPLRRLVQVAGPLQEGIAAGASVFDVLDTPVEDAGGPVPITRARGAVEFRSVDFAYAGSSAKVLEGVSFVAAPGQTVALVGRSGSGKSTLVSLLPRFYDPDAGSVLLDGVEMLGVPTWKRAAAGLHLVMQYPTEVPGVMLNDVLSEALKGRGRDGDIARLDTLLKTEAARIHFDEKFLDRPLNVDLSGGEKKRNETLQLSILKPLFVILDELDSGLDVDALRDCARRVMDATSEDNLGALVITHYSRLLTELRPSKIHILVKGRIVETGGPELADVLERDGYAAFTPAEVAAEADTKDDPMGLNLFP